jgi:hypothetical protein
MRAETLVEKMDRLGNAQCDRITAAGHVLALDDEGKVDRFAYSEGFHNGPVCTRCGDSFCIHCLPLDIPVYQCTATEASNTRSA